MEVKYVTAVMRASLYSFYCWLKNNKGFAVMMLFWPYMMAFFLLGIGALIGSIEEYSVRMKVVNPIFYILASSSVMVSSINIVDSVAGELLRHRWIGTLPYVIASPPRFIVFAIVGPLPTTMISSLISLTSILPAAVYFEGLIGGFKIFVVLLFIYLGMIPLIGLAVVVGGLSLAVGEEANIAGFITPFILLVSGVFYPQTILPWILQIIGRMFPLYYIVEATKILAIYRIPPLSLFYPIVSMLVLLSMLYNTLAAPGILFVERKVLERGNYEV